MKAQQRNRHAASLSRKSRLADMAESKPDAKAAKAFIRKAYECCDVAEYMAKKYDIKVEKKVSEQIKIFLDFIDECGELNSMAYDGVGEEDKRHQDLMHEIEFEEDPDKIAEIGMRIHQNRVQRRVYKNIYEDTSPVMDFVKEPQNKKALDSARQLLGKVRKVEKYHETRTYIPRIKESD